MLCLNRELYDKSESSNNSICSALNNKNILFNAGAAYTYCLEDVVIDTILCCSLGC